MPRTTFYGHAYGNVSGNVRIQPNIGLDAAVRQSVIEILNILLADETVLALNTRSAADQASVNSLPGLCSLFETQAKRINDMLIEVVERVRILGNPHICDSEPLIDSARFDVHPTPDPNGMRILADQEALIRFLREDARKCSEMYEDQGTFALLVSVLRNHEKMAWLLRSNMDLARFDHEK